MLPDMSNSDSAEKSLTSRPGWQLLLVVVAAFVGAVATLVTPIVGRALFPGSGSIQAQIDDIEQKAADDGNLVTERASFDSRGFGTDSHVFVVDPRRHYRRGEGEAAWNSRAGSTITLFERADRTLSERMRVKLAPFATQGGVGIPAIFNYRGVVSFDGGKSETVIGQVQPMSGSLSESYPVAISYDRGLRKYRLRPLLDRPARISPSDVSSDFARRATQMYDTPARVASSTGKTKFRAYPSERKAFALDTENGAVIVGFQADGDFRDAAETYLLRAFTHSVRNGTYSCFWGSRGEDTIRVRVSPSYDTLANRSHEILRASTKRVLRC